MLNIPYTAWELQIGLLFWDDEKHLTKMVEITKKFEDYFPAEKKELNKKIADFHGISVEQLINSPNYKVLNGEYAGHHIREMVASLKKEMGATDVQAWAVIAVAMGTI